MQYNLRNISNANKLKHCIPVDPGDNLSADVLAGTYDTCSATLVKDQMLLC